MKGWDTQFQGVGIRVRRARIVMLQAAIQLSIAAFAGAAGATPVAFRVEGLVETVGSDGLVPAGGWSSAALHGAVAVYENPGDLLAHYGSSILARG